MSRHRSKVDWWLIFLGLVGLVYAAVCWAAVARDSRTSWFWAIFYSLAVVFIVLISWPLYYDVSDGWLVIRMGLLRWRIALDTIQLAAPSRALWKAPALSLDRVQISYRVGGTNASVLVSPMDKQAFMDDLVKHSKSLKRDGDRVVNSGAA